MKHYYVEFETSSRKFNETYIAHQITRDLEKFEKEHKVVKAYEVILGKYNQIKEWKEQVR